MYNVKDEHKKLTFGNIQIKKREFHKSKHLIGVNETNIDKLVISDNAPYSKKDFKLFIGYKDDDKIKPLCVMLPKMSEYFKCFDETKYMSLFDGR